MLCHCCCLSVLVKFAGIKLTTPDWRSEKHIDWFGIMTTCTLCIILYHYLKTLKEYLFRGWCMVDECIRMWKKYGNTGHIQKLNNLPLDTEYYRIYTWFKITTSVSSWWRHDRTDFHITGPFVKGITGQQSSDVDSPHKSILTWSFDVFFDVQIPPPPPPPQHTWLLIFPRIIHGPDAVH